MLDALLEPPLAISYAIIGALAVEHELELSIKSRLRRIPQKEWEAILSDMEGPLGTFDRKIKFAGYLGILDDRMRPNLDIIRNVRNRFAHTKRLISFDHFYVADELTKMAAPKGLKRQFAKTVRLAPQWKHISLCLHCVRQMSKKSYGARSSAHKARMKRYAARSPQIGGLLGLFSPKTGHLQATPLSNLQHQTPKTDSCPNAPAPLGLLGGLFALGEEQLRKKDNKDQLWARQHPVLKHCPRCLNYIWRRVVSSI